MTLYLPKEGMSESFEMIYQHLLNNGIRYDIRVNQGYNSMQNFSENAEKWTCQVQIFMIFIFRVTFL